MLNADSTGNVSAGEKPNPYSADRSIAESSDRQIERLEPRAPAQEFGTEATRQYDAGDIPAMRSVKAGLQYYYSGIYLVTFCFFVGGFLGRLIGPQVAVLVWYGTTLGILIVLFGEIRCLAVPAESDGFRYVVFSVLFYSMGVLLHIIQNILEAQGNLLPRMVAQIGMLQLLFGFLANFFFLTFIICLTKWLNHRSLYKKAMKIRRAIWSMVGFVFIVIFIFIILVNQLPKNGQQLAFVVFGLGVAGFVILVYSWLNRFTRLVQETCSAIVFDETQVLLENESAEKTNFN